MFGGYFKLIMEDYKIPSNHRVRPSLVSEIDKKQKSVVMKKKGLGPAETGSLLKHKELQ